MGNRCNGSANRRPRPDTLDQARCDFSLRLRQDVLLLHEGLLQQGDGVKSTVPPSYWACTISHGLSASRRAGVLIVGALPGPQKGHQSVLHFLGGSEHRLLVGRHQFLEAGVLEADVVQDPSIVQQVPLKRRADRSVEGIGAEQVGEVCAE